MTWVLIALAIAAVVAPIFAIIPSARQRAVMALRRRAMGSGIMVELTRIRDPIPDQEKYRTGTGRRVEPILSVVAYRVHRPRPDDRRAHPRLDWALLRQPGGKLPFVPGWSFEQPVDLPPATRTLLQASLPLLPDDVVKVDEVNYMVSVYWHENSGEAGLDSISNLLTGMKRVTYGNGP